MLDDAAFIAEIERRYPTAEPQPVSWRARQRAAIDMLIELETARLQVTLVPDAYPDRAERGHMLRAVTGRNAAWYRRFCREHAANRARPRRRKRHDTAIKRAHTRRALAEIASGRAETDYAMRLLPHVDRYANNQLIRSNHVKTDTIENRSLAQSGDNDRADCRHD